MVCVMVSASDEAQGLVNELQRALAASCLLLDVTEFHVSVPSESPGSGARLRLPLWCALRVPCVASNLPYLVEASAFTVLFTPRTRDLQ